ncbi:Ras-related protein Rab-8A [Acropora cervicornis]|uniref:Ras-related protein Rab-13 n=1 Tax=Acropora cervicornis TaxID=6130 RepID=A0AAD9PS01_ACRCE|nr:Ras-related protein Rab-8A [Acropora cervicornis]
MSKKYDYLFRLLLVGNSGVGKTCILIRFVENTYSESYLNTIGIDFKIRTVILDGKRIKFQIWDTAGQERFYSITGACYRRALGIMLVYDVTNEASFMNITKWMDKIAENANKEVAKILVANKCDLDGKRKISQEAGESLADALGISYIEVSALSNRNVEEAFITLARNILRRTSNCRQTESAPLDSEKVGLSSDCKSC